MIDSLPPTPAGAADDAADDTANKRTGAAAPHLPLGPVVVDVLGKHLVDEDRRRLLHPLVGGVILFARNFESKKQVTALCEEIHALRTPELPISVDHEGGRVQRFAKGFTEIPPMRDLGAMWDYDVLGACKRATELGQIIGRELLAVGVELSFTPVLDIDYGRSAVIGDRAFHSDPRVVAMLARCLTHGLLLSGMGNCGKHFPGHGHAEADSHHALPVDDRDLETILAADAAPYDWMGDTLLSVMPAHVVYSQVDARPAGFSRLWLQEILRKRLGFKGLIFSDDLTMAGAASAGSIGQRARAALSAGCDMVLVCNQPAQADELLARLSWKSTPAFTGRLSRLLGRAVA
ncbi:MAG: beta-N-acetylhexosaminidase [Burkholderiaceae bacterium]